MRPRETVPPRWTLHRGDRTGGIRRVERIRCPRRARSDRVASWSSFVVLGGITPGGCSSCYLESGFFHIGLTLAAEFCPGVDLPASGLGGQPDTRSEQSRMAAPLAKLRQGRAGAEQGGAATAHQYSYPGECLAVPGHQEIEFRPIK